MPSPTKPGNALIRVVVYINLINAVVVFGAAILLFCPAPHYMLWLAAVAASEMPVQIAAAGAILLAVSLILLPISSSRIMPIISVCLAALAIILALWDLNSIYQYAYLNGQRLSWRETFNFHGLDGKARQLEAQEYTCHDRNALSLDIYEPCAPQISAAPHPAILVIHGGSWRSGRRSDYTQYDYWLAGLGYTVFDIDYRLCNGKVRYPAPVEDIELALKWIQAHAGTYHVDCSRMALLGRSAGAQLALVSAYKTALSSSSIAPVRCVVALYGPTDMVWDYNDPVQPDVINSRVVLENYLGGSPAAVPSLYAQASPVNLVSDKSPATLFLHGGRDQVVDSKNVDRLILPLRTHKIPFEYYFLPWANHGFDWHFNGYSSQIVKTRIAKFLKTNL